MIRRVCGWTGGDGRAYFGSRIGASRFVCFVEAIRPVRIRGKRGGNRGTSERLGNEDWSGLAHLETRLFTRVIFREFVRAILVIRMLHNVLTF